MTKILIVEDDRTIVESVELFLRKESYKTARAKDGKRARELWRSELLNRLIEDLRTLTLADAGKLSLQKQRVDLADLLHGMIETYEENVKARGVTLTRR